MSEPIDDNATIDDVPPGPTVAQRLVSRLTDFAGALKRRDGSKAYRVTKVWVAPNGEVRRVTGEWRT